MSLVEIGDVVVAPCGPGAIRVSGVSGDQEKDWRIVHKLASLLAARAVHGLIGSIPTYESVLVEFDPTIVSASQVDTCIRDALEAINPDEPVSLTPRAFVVPVLYGGEGGPDLETVADATGLDAEAVIRLHLQPEYIVRCLGAPGGSPMLDGPAFPVAIPRLRSPRSSVPARVVSVAGRQATVAPASAPGGWCVIGRTPLTILDIRREPIVPYAPGDRIRFERIDDDEYARLLGGRLEPEGARR
jgi:KipI family sensor histidine kinase inhibitor